MKNSEISITNYPLSTRIGLYILQKCITFAKKLQQGKTRNDRCV